MAGIRIISKEDIGSLFLLSKALEAVEQAYRFNRLFHQGYGEQSP